MTMDILTTSKSCNKSFEFVRTAYSMVSRLFYYSWYPILYDFFNIYPYILDDDFLGLW